MQNARLAVLIDADNTRPDIAAPLLEEIAKYGVASVKRIYGDWTQPNLVGWKKLLIEHAIQPMQQFSYTSGKNSTDSAMIIDAMDLLHTTRFDGFCLVTSDSDFTRLASRLRESGLTVYGFGERKTPRSLVSACDRFIYLDVLRKTPDVDTADAVESKDADAAAGVEKKAAKPAQDKHLQQIMRAAFRATEDEQGFAHLGALGQQLSKQAPDFDPRNYGHKNLSALILALPDFVLDVRKQEGGKSATMYVARRLGDNKKKAK